MDHELTARFAAARAAILGTITPDGTPRLVPITFALDGDRIVTAIDHKPKRTRHLARLDDIANNPDVAVIAHHYGEDWGELWWVRATGRATITDDPEEIAAAGELLAGKYPQYERHPPRGPVIEVAVSGWRGWEAA